MTIHAFTDGASRGNPGEGGIGVILKDEQGVTLTSLSGYIGQTTNNVAEYTALLACLHAAAKTGCTRLVVHSDSELMVRQLNGKYKVKDPILKQYVRKAHSLIEGAPFTFEIKHIIREHNREADQLANIGINSKKKIKV